jgi:ABC-type antimicrobial peptide transport system permease subunit
MFYQILKRIGIFLIVLLLVSVVIFVVLRVLPGDPVTMMLMGSDAYASPEQIEMYKKEMALDKPIIVQYFSFIRNAIHGDLGTSIRFQTPVVDLVLEGSKKTIQLSILGLLVSCLVGFPLGLIGAVYENTWIDTFAMIGSLLDFYAAVLAWSSPNSDCVNQIAMASSDQWKRCHWSITAFNCIRSNRSRKCCKIIQNQPIGIPTRRLYSHSTFKRFKAMDRLN